MTSPPPEQFYQQLPLADTTGHDFELELVTLRSKVDTLELENGELKKILKQRDEERVELTSRIDQTTQERDDLGRQRQSSQIKIRKLSGMIVKNSHSFDEPVDDDILQDMFKVRKNTACSLK